MRPHGNHGEGETDAFIHVTWTDLAKSESLGVGQPTTGITRQPGEEIPSQPSDMAWPEAEAPLEARRAFESRLGSQLTPKGDPVKP